jgi:hypothetical protein
MTILQIPVASAMAWLLAFAFAGAGIFNAMGGSVVQAQFRRWGYPAWWNFITAALEMLSAALNANLGIGARGNGVDRCDCHPHMAPGIRSFAPGRGTGRADWHRIGACPCGLRISAGERPRLPPTGHSSRRPLSTRTPR